MKKLLWLALLLALPAGAQTVTPGLTTPQIQTIISGAATGSTVTFAAGTYNLTAGLTLKCGVTYTGPVANPATAILHGAFARESAIIFSLFTGSGYVVPCTTPTAIQYFDFDYAAGIYVQTSFTNLTITHNQFTNTPCCNNQLYDTMVFFDGSSASTNSQQLLGATTVTWNNFGDGVNSCETPTTGAMRLQNGPAGTIDVTGACAGIRENGSVTGPFVIENNTFNHIGEGVPWGCPKFNTSKYACEPSTTGPQTGSGATLHNITVRYNDFNQVHRIPWELQPQQTSGIDFEFNSLHDFYYPFYNTYGLSWACCENGATAPYLVVNNNAIIENTPPPPCTSWVGYGIEAHGTQASYSNNLVEGNWGQGGSCPNAVTGIAWGFGANPRNYANNTITGPYMHPNYIIAECCSYAAPSNLTGNVTGTTSSAITSVAPTISPAAGAQTFPLTVTLTDPGFTSGPQPLGNHSIWYTTDGSSPVPGSGTAQQLPSGGTFVLASAGTVKAVGMWGTGANTPTYPSGYGFVPSGIVSAAYTGGGTPTAATPVMSPTSQAFSGTLSVSVSDATPSSTIYCTTDGTTPTTGSPVYSGAFSLTITTTIQCIATASGYLQSAVGSGTYTASAPTLTGGFQSNSGSVNTLAVGAPAVQQTAIGTYSDGVNRTLPDAFGNTAVWSSSNGAILNVSGTGMISCVGTGTADSHVTSSPTSKVFNPWTWTCTAAVPAASTGLQVIVISENRKP